MKILRKFAGLFSNKIADALASPMPSYEKTTARQRKIAQSARARFVHESVKLEKVEPPLDKIFGPYMQVGKGSTYKSDRGHARRAADEAAAERGWPNKLRRRLRSQVRQAMEQGS